MSKTEQIAVRLSISESDEISVAAAALELTRSEWLKVAIARQLGKRPRIPLIARVGALERRVSELSKLAGY